MNVLILCTGNSCLSQMGYGYLQSLDSNIEVCSAGCVPAEQVNPNAISTMQEIVIDITTHTPKNVKQYLDQEWDYVITVCGNTNNEKDIWGNIKQNMLPLEIAFIRGVNEQEFTN